MIPTKPPPSFRNPDKWSPVFIDFVSKRYLYYLFILFQAIFMIPTKPPPSFRNPDKWSPEFIDFVSKCLIKNPDQRVLAKELLEVNQLSIFIKSLKIELSVMFCSQAQE